MQSPVIGSLGELLVEFICEGMNGRNLRAATRIVGAVVMIDRNATGGRHACER